jgi:hypothetical protein
MIVFEKLGINFVHSPKTGGSAIARALAVLEGNVDEFDECYARRRQGDFHLTGLHSPCDKPMPGITAVFRREPGDLIESCYNYAKFRGFWKGSAQAFVEQFEKTPKGMPVPLSFYSHYGKSGYLKGCNFIGDFETLEQDFHRLTGGRGELKVVNKIPKERMTWPQKERCRRVWWESL